MKNLLFVFLSLFILTSCGKDDSSCTADDYLGMYTGEKKCGTDSEIITVLISEGNNADEVILTDSQGATSTLILDGCNFTIPKQTDPFFGSESSGNGSLSGETLTVHISVTLFGFTQTCTQTLLKQ